MVAGGAIAALRQRLQMTLQHEVEVLEHQFARNRVPTVRGAARFVDPHRVEVTGEDGERKLYEAARFVIAAGTRPFRPDYMPFDGERVLDSDEIIDLKFLPRSLAVIGAGVIGVEYASIFSALDVQVTLIEPRPSMLDFLDQELVGAFVHDLRDRGIAVRLGCKAGEVEVSPEHGCTVHLDGGRVVHADVVLFAAGRMGATDALNLDAVRLEVDHRGRLDVDPRTFQTKVPHIYAAGDVIGFPSLASTSMEQGRIAACHAFERPAYDPPVFFPYGIYAVPEMSTVGMTEEQVRTQGIGYECGLARFRETSRGHIMGLHAGMMKMLFAIDTRRLLGVHIVGEGATELIHIGQAVLNLGGTLEYFIENTFNRLVLVERCRRSLEVRMIMQLHEVVETSRRVGEVAGRLAKIGHLADCLAHCGPDEAASAVALLSGTPRQGRIGIGYAALRAARGEPPAAEASITLRELEGALDELKAVKGKGASGERARLLRALFGRATEAEQDFLLRLLVGELRQGALEGVMVDAIAKAAGLPASEVRRAVMLAGDAGVVAAAALGAGAAGLRRFGLVLMQPVQPMLAQSADDIADAWRSSARRRSSGSSMAPAFRSTRPGTKCGCSRARLNDVTAAVPEVVAAVRGLPLESAILDGEAIALRPDGRAAAVPDHDAALRPAARGRAAAGRAAARLPVLRRARARWRRTDRPAAMRSGSAALAAVLPPALTVPRLVTGEAAAATAFVGGALAKGHEGAMAKALDAPYQAGRRGAGWLKVKQAHTLDLVVLAAEWGSGRRKGWLSNLHLGARDPDAGGFVMLGKTFKGLTDEVLAWQTEQFLVREIGRDAYTVYVRPELVVEIAFNDLQDEPSLSGRPRAAIRAGQGLPVRQAGGGRGHDRDRSGDPCARGWRWLARTDLERAADRPRFDPSGGQGAGVWRNWSTSGHSMSDWPSWRRRGPGAHASCRAWRR